MNPNDSKRSFVGINASFMAKKPLFNSNKGLFSKRRYTHDSQMPCQAEKHHKTHGHHGKTSIPKKLVLLFGAIGSYLFFLAMLFVILFIAVLALSLGYWSGKKIVDYTHKCDYVAKNIKRISPTKHIKLHEDIVNPKISALNLQHKLPCFNKTKKGVTVNHQLLELYS